MLAWHYGKTYVCRASNFLSCALFRAHGKEIGCRAFFIQRTAKKKRTASKLFAVRQKKTHGKDLIYSAFYFLAHDKDFSPTGR
jgi:hypothetical protein